MTSAQRVAWHSFDLRSGRRGPELIAETQGALKRALCETTDLTGHRIRIWQDGRPVPGWAAATLPGRTMLVALDRDTDDPVWGGMVLRRRSDPSEWTTVDLVTLEAYLDRRYVTDATFTATDQAVIAEALVDGTVNTGVEFVLDRDTGLTQELDRDYLEDDDKTVLSALQELASIENGLEYTVDLAWADPTHTRLQRILRLRNHIGSTSKTPAAQFTLPGCVTDFEYLEDYSADNAANTVQATSDNASGEEGAGRLESEWWSRVDPGWAVFEKKIAAATAAPDVATLDATARELLAQTWDGLTELTLTAQLQTAPRLGRDWFLGDEIGISLSCPRFPAYRDADGRLVPGAQAKARVTAWELDLEGSTVKPTITLVDDDNLDRVA